MKLQVTRESTAIDVAMYSRPACHLCDAAADVIRSVQNQYEFEFRVVNIENDIELESRYGRLIPVVEINGRPVFKYRVEKSELEREIERLWNQ
jgi:glutaredoxin